MTKQNQSEILFVSTFSHHGGKIYQVEMNGDFSVAFENNELAGANITGIEFRSADTVVVATFDRIIEVDVASKIQKAVAQQPVLEPFLPTFWTDICVVDGQLFATVSKPAAFVKVNVGGSLERIELSFPPNSCEGTKQGTVLVSGDDQIWEFSPDTGDVKVLMAEGAQNNDFAVSNDRVLFLAKDSQIHRFDLGTGDSSLVAENGNLRNTQGIALYSNYLFVSDLAEGSVTRVSIDSGEQETIVAAGELENPGRIAFLIQ